MSSSQRAWEELIREVARDWESDLDDFERPFGERVPRPVRIFFSNTGSGKDGTTQGADTIILDLSAWERAYGPPVSGARERVKRILSHEFTHLAVKAWAKRNPQTLRTPLERAFWEMFNEGLGNYHSLSEKWAGPAASEALARLEPIWVDRVIALSRARSEEEMKLLEGLSSGPFEHKWGALPVALWLTRENDLEAFVASGPAGVLPLAKRHLSAESLERLRGAGL